MKLTPWCITSLTGLHPCSEALAGLGSRSCWWSDPSKRTLCTAGATSLSPGTPHQDNRDVWTLRQVCSRGWCVPGGKWSLSDRGQDCETVRPHNAINFESENIIGCHLPPVVDVSASIRRKGEKRQSEARDGRGSQRLCASSWVF